ncbi:hypothetical protein N7478_009795 [Penicillium angulare]|uniref:uncharacterized protein n=1 Tax=Penicillium angulare TaxID=116970 RepID=UPI002541D55A|nr:uncharacterized protein N7478_009795 [Penicillium angulare]KAJ5266987.1 hypothetical protein N7478_009795 [Penicillium angulare]
MGWEGEIEGDKAKGVVERKEEEKKRNAQESAEEDLRRSYLQCGGDNTIPQYLGLEGGSDRP